jgi:chromosome partitioning protein
MRTLAIASSKGGVGKTTLSVHLAEGFARQGHKTLLIDLDPQASATAWLMGLQNIGAPGIADALHAKRIEDKHVHQIRPELELLPSSQAIADEEARLSGAAGGQAVLRRILRDQAGRWDYVLLDCPPTFGTSVIGAMVAAEAVIAPVTCSYLALAGLRQLEETLDDLRKNFELTTTVLGYVLFATNASESITEESRAHLKKTAGTKLYRAEVRTSTANKALPGHQRTAWDDGADPRGREDYEAVLRETLMRLGDGKKAKKAKVA